MAKDDSNDDNVRRSTLSSRYILTVIFSGVAAISYYFWAVPYRAALGYREQLQLFQTTGTYFKTLAGRPGGVTTYIGEFLTQFFNDFRTGAAVMTGLLLIFMLLSYLINKRFAPS